MPPTSTKDAPSAAARRLLQAPLREVRAQLALIAAQRKALPDLDPGRSTDEDKAARRAAIKDMANATAALARAATGAAAEMRKLDVYDTAAARKLTAEERDELVMTYIEDMTAERRRRLRERLDEIERLAPPLMGIG